MMGRSPRRCKRLQEVTRHLASQNKTAMSSEIFKFLLPLTPFDQYCRGYGPVVKLELNAVLTALPIQSRMPPTGMTT
jgi:hypothetical protein